MKLISLVSGSTQLQDSIRNTDIRGLSVDSRQVKNGYLFAALKGFEVDGAVFVKKAIANGASVILASHDAAIENCDIDIVRVADPRQEIALIAGRFYARQPENIVAVTGTNGKSSIVSFCRQIWSRAGLNAASIGTIGIETAFSSNYGGLTTPDPVELHKIVENLSIDDQISHLALEASSHGLDQKRLDGMCLKAAAFTNLSRDHMDYHDGMDAYLDAKSRLFAELLPSAGTAVFNVDDDVSASLIKISKNRGHKILSVGVNGVDIQLLSNNPDGSGQTIQLAGVFGDVTIRIPLVGSFQVSNALVAAALCFATGTSVDDCLDGLANLTGARGRLELIGNSSSGSPVYIDFSHTPDALETALGALRPFVTNRLLVVFGAGGDRDPGKRILMGAAGHQFADVVIVTDDNPRTEDPALIRQAVLKGAPEGKNIGDRQTAIKYAIGLLQSGDVLLIAGKGHETGQEIMGISHPFSDHTAVTSALASGVQ